MQFAAILLSAAGIVLLALFQSIYTEIEATCDPTMYKIISYTSIKAHCNHICHMLGCPKALTDGHIACGK